MPKGIVATTREVIMKLKNLIKYILSPVFRRSTKIARYIEQGYSHQEALAKVKVIEV